MKRTLGYGLILLAASALASRSALALGRDALGLQGSEQALYLLGAAPTRSPQGYLGISVHDIAPDQVAALKLKEARGAEIVLVDHDAPAGKAGLREHDVVLQLNGQTVTGEDQVRRLLHECPPGKTVTLLISRDGQQMTVSAQMAVSQEEVERQAWEQRLIVPEPPPPPPDMIGGSDYLPAPAQPAPVHSNSFIGTMLMNSSYTGAMLEKMSSQLADYFGVAGGTGLLVRSVEANSPAATAGMRAGDVVVRANAKPVASTGDWAKAVKSSRGRPLTVVVMRDRKEQTLTLTPDSKKRSSLDEPMENFDRIVVAHLGLPWAPRS